MILVTVGAIWPFDRLVRTTDELALQLNEPVIIQRGAGRYIPQFAQHVTFVDGAMMERWLSESRVVISHAGGGSILGVLRAGKPLVLAPRIAGLGEHIDDHQFELAEAMVEQRRAVVVTELSVVTLIEAIEQAEQLNGEREVSETGLHATLRDWLAEQARQPQPRWQMPFHQKWRRGG